MTNVCYLKYETRCSGGIPESDEPYCCLSDEHNEFIPQGLFATRKSANSTFPETIEIDFEPVVGKVYYLVVVRYTTGSTFGMSYGNWSVIGVFENVADAAAVKSAIQKTDDGKTHTYECDVPTPNDPDHWCNWNGYFERLEEVQVDGFQMT